MMDATLLPSLPALDPVIGHAAAASIAAILILAAIEKLREPELFRDAVENYRLVPDAAAAVLARLLPLLEGVAGAALLPAATRPWGAALAIALLALVTGAVLLNVLRGRTRIDCGCGGDQHLPLGAGLVGRNVVLLAVAVLAFLPSTARPAVWLDAFATAACVLGLLALHAATNALLRNHSRLTDLRNAS
jgi:hypothetical protein